MIIWYLRILSHMTWHHLRSPHIFWNHRKYPQIFAVQFKILGIGWDHMGSPDVVGDHLEMSWDHQRSPKITSVQLRSASHQLILEWYYLTWLDITWGHVMIFWNHRKYPQIFAVQFKILGRAWDRPGIIRHFPRSLEIRRDQLRSPQITSAKLGSSEIIWYLLI